MISNYFKTAFRNLLRNRSYAFINIAGLATGIAVCLVIFIIIRFHSGFDEFHAKKDRIYRVLTEYRHADSKDVFYGRGVPTALPRGLKNEFPEIEKVAPIYADYNDQFLVPGENGESSKKFKEEKGVFFTEPSFFSIFDFPLLAGSYTSLNDPDNALLTKETAEKYFGDWKTAMGKSIRLNNSNTLKVSGVLANVPPNTDFQLKVVIAYGTGFTSDFTKSTDWDNTGSSFGCYVLLPPRVSAGNFSKQLRTYVKKVKAPDNLDSHVIQSLSEVHFDTKAGSYGRSTISHQLINVLWLIAAFILLIACVNFINLSTAQSVHRAKEVGIRKVLGSNKMQLGFQFLAETFLIALTALVLAVLAAAIALPFVNKILTVSLSIDAIKSIAAILFLISITIIVTVLAGIYPAVILSRFNPISALKSKISNVNVKGISLRRGLVVFQFIIAQALIIGTLVIVRQMDYFDKQPLGFDKAAVVNIPFPTDSAAISKLDYLKKQLTGIGGIQGVSFSSNTPVEDNNDDWTQFLFNHSDKSTGIYAINKSVDDQYLPTYKLPLVAGRNLTPSDTAKEFLVNETLLKKLGINDPQEALNKEMSIWGGRHKGPVVGVMKDFNNRSFRTDIAPLLVTTRKKAYSETAIKLSTTDIAAEMHAIEQVWNQVFPDYVFEYKFLDEKVENFYKQESQLSQLYKVFAVIAIFLSCLGLYGLASFMAVQRIKEVGIRKVLGATAGNIVYLFSKEFVLLILIAFIIAAPVAGYFMHQWLQDYTYRINMSWWIFIAGGAVSVVIALLTVSFQAIKAAVANPVKSLRTDS